MRFESFHSISYNIQKFLTGISRTLQQPHKADENSLSPFSLGAWKETSEQRPQCFHSKIRTRPTDYQYRLSGSQEW